MKENDFEKNMTSKRALEWISRLEMYDKEKHGITSTVYDCLPDCFELIKRNLEVLEIIKKKKVSTTWLSMCSIVDQYNELAPKPERYLTEEEFVLLKEVLTQ